MTSFLSIQLITSDCKFVKRQERKRIMNVSLVMFVPQRQFEASFYQQHDLCSNNSNSKDFINLPLLLVTNSYRHEAKFKSNNVQNIFSGIYNTKLKATGK